MHAAPAMARAAAQTVEAQRGDGVAVAARQPEPSPALVGLPGVVAHHGPGSSGFFLKPLQGLLKTARMNPDAELGLDQRGQPARSHPAVPGPVVLDEAQDLRADLVRVLAARAAPG